MRYKKTEYMTQKKNRTVVEDKIGKNEKWEKF